MSDSEKPTGLKDSGDDPGVRRPDASATPDTAADQGPVENTRIPEQDERATPEGNSWSGGSYVPPAGRRRKGRRLVKPEDSTKPSFSPERRLLVLDIWKRSGLDGSEFGQMIGLTRQTLHTWKKRFEEHGPAGLMDEVRGARKGSRVPEITKRTILMLKEGNPEFGCQRISDMLARGPALPASASAVATVLKEAGYELDESHTRPHPDHPRRFERARPNQLWQTDIFTFVLKRQNRRVYLVNFLDDHSRFVVSYGLYATASSALVIEALRAGIASYGSPEEVLSDNGPQYVTWRGTSTFARELAKRGIQHVVAAPRRPQTLGKAERFWGTLWRECLEAAVFLDLSDARRRIGLFIDHYNLARPHQSLNGLVPADRFFGAAPEVAKTLKARVAANALELARQGIPRKPFYVTGQVGGKTFSVHAEGERVILRNKDGERQEIDLVPPSPEEPTVPLPDPVCPHGAPTAGDPATEEGNEEPPPPGVSAVDELVRPAEPMSKPVAPASRDGETPVSVDPDVLAVLEKEIRRRDGGEA